MVATRKSALSGAEIVKLSVTTVRKITEQNAVKSYTIYLSNHWSNRFFDTNQLK